MSGSLREAWGGSEQPPEKMAGRLSVTMLLNSISVENNQRDLDLMPFLREKLAKGVQFISVSELTSAARSSRVSSAMNRGELVIDELLKQADLDGDGVIDEEDLKLAKVLRDMDQDGSGTISIKELVHIGQNKMKDEKKIRNMWKLIGAVVIASLLFCGAMLGMMILANEASKEDKPDKDGTLKTIDGTPISTELSLTSVTLSTLPEYSLDDIATLRHLMVEIDDETRYYTVQGFTWRSSSNMDVITARGDVIRIRDGEVYIDEADQVGATNAQNTESTVTTNDRKLLFDPTRDPRRPRGGHAGMGRHPRDGPRMV